MKVVRRTLHGWSAAAILALALAIAWPPASHAQTAAVPSTLPGTWVYEGEAARAMQIVQSAFASTVATLPEMLQGFARDRIRSDMEPPRRVLVSVEGARVRVTLDRTRTTVVSGALGSTASTTGVQDGTVVSTSLQGGCGIL